MAVWYHADITRQRFFGFVLRPVIWFILREARTILVAGQGIVDNSPLLKKFKEKCAIIPFGIDAGFAATTPEVAKEAAAIRGNDPRPLILTLARAVSYKGLEYLIDALPSVDARFILLGGGPLLPALKARARDRGVADRVSFVGAAPDSRAYFAACDIFVLPSVTPAEAFAVVEVEAMAYGKPVVNTSLPSAVPEVSLHGVTGITVPPRDTPALAEAMNRLLSDAGLRKKYGEAGRERFLKEFTRDVFAERVERELSRLMPR
jgi:rhamnosyl/mannosyltransferase